MRAVVRVSVCVLLEQTVQPSKQVETMGKGKEYERKFVRALKQKGWVAERVPRSVADASAVDDVLAAPPWYEADDEDGNRPITKPIQRQELSHVDPIQIEVKYTSTGSYGLPGLYRAHLETVGLGGLQPIEWPGEIWTGGIAAFASMLDEECFGLDAWERDESLAKGTLELLEPALVDAAALRAPRKPWVLVWERCRYSGDV